MLLVGSFVRVSMTMKLDSDIFHAERQMYAADRLVMHVGSALYLCQDIGYIPYPLNYYIGEEAFDVLHPR